MIAGIGYIILYFCVKIIIIIIIFINKYKNKIINIYILYLIIKDKKQGGTGSNEII